jgi:NAD(P)-dependent dehydrogenase (short-subunit alcohol dehydrogenase family)
MLLEGTRALVTGAASGIGLALCRGLKSAGAEPILIDVDDRAGQQAADRLDARFFHCDVSDPAEWEQTSRRIEQVFGGGIDVACLNAGVRCRQRLIDQLDRGELTRVTGVNIGGVVFGIQHAVRLMAARGGTIVVTASIAGLRPTDADPIYSMTKHAVIGLMGGLVPQLQARNIAINAVCPSPTDTPMLRENVEFYEGLQARQEPLLAAESVAEAALSLLRSGGTGQALVCRVGHVPYPWRFRQPDLSVADWYRA